MGQLANEFSAWEDVAATNRRLRRRARKQMRRTQASVSIALVAGAWLLSMGVIQIMELPRSGAEAAAAKRATPVTALPAEAPAPRAPLATGADPGLTPDVGGVLGVSLLDADAQVAPGTTSKTPSEDGAGEPQSDPLRPYSTIEISSTSKDSAAPGGMAGGAPRSP